ncbi:MAG TPA: thioesterase family protein [Micromonosporaceae bacterium]
MAGFDMATAVEVDAARYTAQLDPDWTVGGRPNGGYLLAILARAAIAADDQGAHPHPLSASAVYLNPPEVGPATVEVEPLRRGRTASHLRARLSQRGRPCVEALFTLGRLTGDNGRTWIDAPAPELADEAECLLSPIEPPGTGMRIAMLGQLRQRLDLNASFGQPESGEIRGWLRFADETPFDPVSLLFAADSFPPATLTLGSIGWVPTLELTVYVRAEPAPGPLRVRQRARLLSANLVDQVCEVWDSRGQVVAQASQLAAVRMGADPAANEDSGSSQRS